MRNVFYENSHGCFLEIYKNPSFDFAFTQSPYNLSRNHKTLKKRDFSSIFFAFQKIRFIVAEKNISWFHHPLSFYRVQLDLLGFVGEKARIVTFQNSQIYMIKCYSVLLWVRWCSDQSLLVTLRLKNMRNRIRCSLRWG